MQQLSDTIHDITVGWLNGNNNVYRTITE